MVCMREKRFWGLHALEQGRNQALEILSREEMQVESQVQVTQEEKCGKTGIISDFLGGKMAEIHMFANEFVGGANI